MPEIQPGDRERLAAQEDLLVFPEFNLNTAWELGNRLRARAERDGLPILIDIAFGEHSVFRTALEGTTPANADWARRKRNLVNLMHRSSYAIGLADEGYVELMGLDQRDYTPHGGCFPVRVKGVGMVATVTVSGLPQRQDHNLVVEVVAEQLGIDLGANRLG